MRSPGRRRRHVGPHTPSHPEARGRGAMSLRSCRRGCASYAWLREWRARRSGSGAARCYNPRMNAAPRRSAPSPEASARYARRGVGRRSDGVRPIPCAHAARRCDAPRRALAVAVGDRPYGGATKTRAAGPGHRAGDPATRASIHVHATIPGVAGPGMASTGCAARLAERPIPPVRRREAPGRDRVSAAASTRRNGDRTGRSPVGDAAPDAPETGARPPPTGPDRGVPAPPDPG